MGELYKLASALQKEEDERKILEEAARESYEDEMERKYFEREAMKEAAINKRVKFSEYKKSVKRTLLREALTRICTKSLRNPSENEISVCESLIENYVAEKDIDELLESFKGRTSFLENLNANIMKHYNAILEEVDETNEDTMGINPDKLDDFFEDIDEVEDVEDITDTIRMRVANAEEEFVNRVEEDNQNLKTIIKSTAQRVQDAKQGLDNEYDDDDSDPDSEDTDIEIDTEDEVQQEAVRFAKQQMYEVQHRKPRNVFDRMVRNLTEASVRNHELRDQLVSENGRTDMDKVVESVRCMYTLLEMVMALRIEDVDAKYIQDTLDSIK